MINALCSPRQRLPPARGGAGGLGARPPVPWGVLSQSDFFESSGAASCCIPDIRCLDVAQQSHFATELRAYAEAMGEEERLIASRLGDLHACPAMGRSATRSAP